MVVRASDLLPIGCMFESRPLCFTYNLGKLFTHTHMCLCLQSSINWYRCKLGAKQTLYTTHWFRVHGLAASADVWVRATETEISAKAKS